MEFGQVFSMFYGRRIRMLMILIAAAVTEPVQMMMVVTVTVVYGDGRQTVAVRTVSAVRNGPG